MQLDDKTAVSPLFKLNDLLIARNQNDNGKLIEIITDRIYGWYIEPTKLLSRQRNNGFLVMAIICILLDTLSQFYYGSNQSNRSNFKNFLRDFNSRFTLPASNSRDCADVFYKGFRCGILHEAKISEGEINGSARFAINWKNNKLIVNPDLLLKQVDKYYKNYLKKLKRNERLVEFQNKIDFYLTNI
ncbi:MAG: hypothetical protein AABX51_02450 [Nanoarchaeota archaeon]